MPDNSSNDFIASRVERAEDTDNEEVRQKQERAKEIVDNSNAVLVLGANTEKEEVVSELIGYDIDVVDLMAIISGIEKTREELLNVVARLEDGELE